MISWKTDEHDCRLPVRVRQVLARKNHAMVAATRVLRASCAMQCSKALHQAQDARESQS